MPILAHRRRRHFERLEARQMLAGNVTAEIVDGDLIVMGDGLTVTATNDVGNQTIDQFTVNVVEPPPVSGLTTVTVQNGTLLIEGDDGESVVSITGIGTGSGVYLVETPEGSQTVSGIIGGIMVNLAGGNDSLVMNNVYVGGAISIQTGDGDDTVVLGDRDVVSSRGNLQVNLGAGNDQIDGKRLYIGFNQSINGEEGNDQLIFEGFASPFTIGTSGARNVACSGGSGNDLVSVKYAFVVGPWVVDLGEGEDALYMLYSAASSDVIALGGEGLDTLHLDANFLDANVRIEGNAGSSSILLANGLGTEIALIQLNGTGDNVTVLNQTAVQLYVVDQGNTVDDVKVTASALDYFFVALGGADDQLTIRGNLFRFSVDLDGGEGIADRLLNLGNDVRGAYKSRAFELFAPQDGFVSPPRS
jgi:hypothetical protein